METTITSNCNCTEFTIAQFTVEEADLISLEITLPNNEIIEKELYIAPEEPIEVPN